MTDAKGLAHSFPVRTAILTRSRRILAYLSNRSRFRSLNRSQTARVVLSFSLSLSLFFVSVPLPSCSSPFVLVQLLHLALCKKWCSVFFFLMCDSYSKVVFSIFCIIICSSIIISCVWYLPVVVWCCCCCCFLSEYAAMVTMLAMMTAPSPSYHDGCEYRCHHHHRHCQCYDLS